MYRGETGAMNINQRLQNKLNEERMPFAMVGESFALETR